MSRPIAREILRLGWPVYIAQLAIMANGVIDTVMAGRYGTADLAAVGIGASVYATLFITLMGVLFAMTPIVAQLHGAARPAAVGEEVRQSAWLGLLLATASAVMLTHPGPLLAISELAPDVEVRTRAYLDAIAWGVPAAFLFRVFSGFSTAISQPRAIMVLNLIGLALKVPLNLVFMYGYLGMPALGGPGCAVATALIAWLTCALAWYWCWRAADYRPYRVFARWSWPRPKALGQLLALGLPIGATFLVDVTAFTFMALFIARLGARFSAAHQIAANLAALTFMLPLAIGNATAVLAGQAIGARHFVRARTTGLVGIALGLAFSFAVAAALFFGAGPVTGLYTGDATVQRTAAGLLTFVAVYHVFDALQAVSVNVLRAYKRTLVPMILYALALWGVGLAGGYVLGLKGLGALVAPLGASGFWLAGSVGMALTGVLAALYFLRISRAPAG